MKRIYSIALLILAVTVSSCKKNNGIDSYSEAEVITITGIESSYSKTTFKDFIELNPTVTSNKDADFEYLWGMYEMGLVGNTLDTIGWTKDIKYEIKRTAKDWMLVFRVRNKKTGYLKYFNSVISIGTEFTNGWYVLKDDGIQTDADLFPTPKSIIPLGIKEDVYSLVNGKKLKGKATLLNFYDDYKAVIDGVPTSTRSLFLVTDQDASAVNISTLKDIRDFNSLFVEAPAVRDIGFVASEIYQGFYMLNNGQLHSITSAVANTGRFGSRKIKNDRNDPYHLSRYHLMYVKGAYFFDEMSSSFISAAGGSIYLTPISDDPETQMPANNNNKKLLYMGLKNSSPFSGYAMLQDKTNPSIKILSTVIPSVSKFKIVNDVLLPTDKIYNGSNFALLYQDEQMIYFSVGQQIWSRNLANKFEQLQYTLPADEEVTFIRHRKYVGKVLQLPFSYNYVMVGSKKGGNYKIRMFSKTSGNLDSEPALVLEGKGRAADAMFISPSINSATYMNTF